MLLNSLAAFTGDWRGVVVAVAAAGGDGAGDGQEVARAALDYPTHPGPRQTTGPLVLYCYCVTRCEMLGVTVVCTRVGDLRISSLPEITLVATCLSTGRGVFRGEAGRSVHGLARRSSLLDTRSRQCQPHQTGRGQCPAILK